MIELCELVTGYVSRWVSPPVTATIPAGQMTVMLGPNGVGKSTLLRTLCGFQPPISGKAFIDGAPLSSLSIRKMSRLAAVVLTERISVEGLSAEQLVALGRNPHTNFWGSLSDNDHEAVRKAIGQVGLSDLATRKTSTLSDGELQKALIARALAQDTPVILLDEPTAFLDFPSKVEMLRLLRHIAHSLGKVVLLSTHDVELALQHADSVWLMSRMGITAGHPETLARQGEIASFFHTEGMKFHPSSLTFTTLS